MDPGPVPAAVSAAVGGVANFAVNTKINTQTNFDVNTKINTPTDSAMVKKLQDFSTCNAVLGVPTHERLVADSPMVKCLQETAGNGANCCAPGIAYVFHERRSQGKSSAIRYFCRKDCRKSGRRSIHIGASSAGGGPTTYFQRVAADLNVSFHSNWAGCLVAAMTKAPTETLSPFLFLDEFNDGTVQDLQDMNRFMRACQNLGFYLIIVTSERKVADNVMSLNAWGKMRPLKYIHDGPTMNVKGQPGYSENKTANWKSVDWTHEQLKNVVITHQGEFDNYSFIQPGFTPTDALVKARQIKQGTSSAVPSSESNLSPRA